MRSARPLVRNCCCRKAAPTPPLPWSRSTRRWAPAGRSHLVGTKRENCHEDFFLERERHSRGAQEGAVPAVSRPASARYRLSAGDQGRARTIRDRFTRLPRVLEFGGEEGLFGHRNFLEGRAAVRRQRL